MRIVDSSRSQLGGEESESGHGTEGGLAYTGFVVSERALDRADVTRMTGDDHVAAQLGCVAVTHVPPPTSFLEALDHVRDGPRDDERRGDRTDERHPYCYPTEGDQIKNSAPSSLGDTRPGLDGCLTTSTVAWVRTGTSGRLAPSDGHQRGERQTSEKSDPKSDVRDRHDDRHRTGPTW